MVASWDCRAAIKEDSRVGRQEPSEATRGTHPGESACPNGWTAGALGIGGMHSCGGKAPWSARPGDRGSAKSLTRYVISEIWEKAMRFLKAHAYRWVEQSKSMRCPTNVKN